MVDLDQGVESLSQNVQKVLMEMDIELYEAFAVKFELETKREAQLAAAATEVPRVADWETVEQLAMRYLSESCTFIFASVTVPTLPRQSRDSNTKKRLGFLLSIIAML